MQEHPNPATMPEKNESLSPGHQDQSLQESVESKQTFSEDQLRLYYTIAKLLGERVSPGIRTALDSAENGSANVVASDDLYDMTDDESTELAAGWLLACKDEHSQPQDFLNLFAVIWKWTKFCDWDEGARFSLLLHVAAQFDDSLSAMIQSCLRSLKAGSIELSETSKNPKAEYSVDSHIEDRNFSVSELFAERDVRISQLQDVAEKASVHISNLANLLKWSGSFNDLTTENKAMLEHGVIELQEFNSHNRAEQEDLLRTHYRLYELVLKAHVQKDSLKEYLEELSEKVKIAKQDNETLEREMSSFNHNNCIPLGVHLSSLEERRAELLVLLKETSQKSEAMNAMQKKFQSIKDETAKRDRNAQREIHDLRTELVLAKDDIPRQRKIEELEKAVRESGVVLKKRDQTIENLKKKVLDLEAAASYEGNFREAEKENIRLLDELYDAQKKIEQKDEELSEAILERDNALNAKSSAKPDIITEPVIIMPKGESTSNEQHLQMLLQDLQRKLSLTETNWEKSKQEVEKLTAEKQSLLEEVEKHQSSEEESHTEHKSHSINDIITTYMPTAIVSARATAKPLPRPSHTQMPALTNSEFPPINPDISVDTTSTSTNSSGNQFAQSSMMTKMSSSTATHAGNSYAAAAKKPAVETRKATRRDIKIGKKEENVPPSDSSRSLTGVESAGHGRGKKGLTNMLKKQIQHYNARK